MTLICYVTPVTVWLELYGYFLSVTKRSSMTSTSHKTPWWGIRPYRIISVRRNIAGREKKHTKNAIIIQLNQRREIHEAGKEALPLGSMDRSNFGHQNLFPHNQATYRKVSKIKPISHYSYTSTRWYRSICSRIIFASLQ